MSELWWLWPGWVINLPGVTSLRILRYQIVPPLTRWTIVPWIMEIIVKLIMVYLLNYKFKSWFCKLHHMKICAKITSGMISYYEFCLFPRIYVYSYFCVLQNNLRNVENSCPLLRFGVYQIWVQLLLWYNQCTKYSDYV